MKYYRLINILKKNCRYNVIFGERSNGKTYSVLEYALKQYFTNNKQLAVIRRWGEDFKRKRAQTYFNSLSCNGKKENVIKRLSKGKYDRIIYLSAAWYLAYFDKELNKIVTDSKPFAFAFALSEWEHDKGNSYSDVCTILFDEFITRGVYLNDEFVLFMNTVSTIVRDRDDVKIFMCANTVSRFCLYFSEMGLKHVKQMKKGDIDVYEYGDSNLRVAVEYADSPSKNKPSDVYFAFDNPKLKMITGGDWELSIYPHLKYKNNKNDIIFTYFIMFDDHTLQADIYDNEHGTYTYIHLKTTDIKKPEEDIIFSPDAVELNNCYTNIARPVNKLTKKIYWYFIADKVFYQTNDIGDIVNSYITNCKHMIR